MAARPFRAPHEITDVFRLVQGLPECQRAGKRNEQDEEPLHDLNGTPPVRHRHSSAVETTPSPTRSRSDSTVADPPAVVPAATPPIAAIRLAGSLRSSPCDTVERRSPPRFAK